MTSVLLLVGLVLALAAGLRAYGVLEPPRLALALMMITAPLEVYRTEAIVGNLSVFRVALVFGVVVALLEGPRALRRLTGPVILSAGALVLLMVLSAVTVSSNHGLAVSILGQGVVGFVALCTVALLGTRCAPLEPLIWICVGGSVSLLLAGAQGIAAGMDDIFVMPFLDRLPVPEGLEVTRMARSQLLSGELRLRAAFGDPNHFAIALVLAGTAGLALLTTLKPKSWRFAAVALWLVAVGVTLLGTLSRTGWVAAGVAVVALAVVAAADPESRRLIFGSRTKVAALVVAGLAVAIVSAGPVLSRVDGERRTNQLSNEVHERTVQGAFDEMVSHPVLGVGLADLGPILKEGPKASGAHSSFLTVGAELGLPGLLALTAFMVAVLDGLIRRGVADRANRWAFRVLACGYGGFVAGNLVYDLHLDDVHWVFAGIAAVPPLVAAVAAGEAAEADPVDGQGPADASGAALVGDR